MKIHHAKVDFHGNKSGWTIGFLGNHLWSFAGDDKRPDVNATFVQPFVSYLYKKTFTTFGLNTESTYDWETEAWSVPVNMTVSQMLQIAGMPVSLVVGARYWADTPEMGPEGWGVRAGITFLFPK